MCVVHLWKPRVAFNAGVRPANYRQEILIVFVLRIVTEMDVRPEGETRVLDLAHVAVHHLSQPLCSMAMLVLVVAMVVIKINVLRHTVMIELYSYYCQAFVFSWRI